MMNAIMTEGRIRELEGMGFKRWTKGNYDRLYINADKLGLDCDYYKTGNISSATFGGKKISNSMAREMKAAKTYIDVRTGRVYSDSYTLQRTVENLIDDEDE